MQQKLILQQMQEQQQQLQALQLRLLNGGVGATPPQTPLSPQQQLGMGPGMGSPNPMGFSSPATVMGQGLGQGMGQGMGMGGAMSVGLNSPSPYNR